MTHRPALAAMCAGLALATRLVLLSVAGGLGVLCRPAAIKAGKRRPHPTATALCVLATATALTSLLVEDTSGDTGLPPLLGLLGLLPCTAGLVAVALLLKRFTPSTATRA